MKHLFVFSTLLCICFFCSNIYTVEYLYPIDTFKHEGDDIVLIMHQVSNREIQLLAWHAEKEIYIPLLSKQYNPTSVKLLPDKNGFSFIDNGLLKIKKFDKRSVHIVEFDKPLYNIGYIQWINPQQCYFHAKYGERYGIYKSNMEGEITPLITDTSCNNMYPQKIDDTIFCIEHIHHQYKVIAVHHSQDSLHQVKTVVKDFGNIAIAYLTMTDRNEGFVIAHPKYIETHSKVINFQMYQIKIFDGISSCEKILDFNLPTKLFFDNNYLLHEGIIPFLPRISKQGINFNDTKRSKLIDPMYYLFKDRSIKECFCECFFQPPSQKTIIGFFAPILVGQYYIYGYACD
ncbi:MAG TPA: hypothetical protein PLU71_01310 [Candidatus Dependentiae bacterium]|nr:hypothetical protein [Candidatus Dependentiae bacterium]HRQ62469.1 hypothetical protein [Candidatus Dependentiae bacterium]